jgi:CheY-like chemotaxis protein
MEGHRVDVELSAREALERLKSNSYDIVLSDMRMPELDGVSLHRILEESHPALAQRLGFITGDTLTGRVSDFLASHDCPYIEKPFMPADLRDLVQRVLAKQAG